MKFIRDIIGEKRGMDSVPAMNGAAHEPRDADKVAAPVAASATPPQARVAPVMQDKDVSDQIAAFFAKEQGEKAHDETAQSETDTDATPEVTSEAAPVPERKPTKLILGAPQRADVTPAPQPEVAKPEGEAEKTDDTADDIDRVLVSEHNVDPALHNVFKSSEAEHKSASEAPAAMTRPAPVETAQVEQADADMPPAMPFVAAAPQPAPVSDNASPVEVPRPAVGRGSGSHGRVKTRLLGFNASMDTDIDPMTANQEASAAPSTKFPVGWLMVVDGEGRGSAFTLFHGVSTIGRGSDQTVRLDFGDNSISRENHASVAYDPRQKSFFIGHGGKANIVRRNDRPVLSTEELASGDTITIGETTLRFVPCCGPDFSWEDGQETGRAHASFV